MKDYLLNLLLFLLYLAVLFALDSTTNGGDNDDEFYY